MKPLGDIFTPKKGKSITKKTIVEGCFPIVSGGLEPNVDSPAITISASGAYHY